MNIFKSSKGFTIIELLVVVAIIAILAAIVLVNVTQYIAKGRDAAIRANMATLLTNGAVYYDTNNSNFSGFSSAAATSYTPVLGAACAGGNATFLNPCTAISTAGGGGYPFTIYCSDGAAAANCNAATVRNWCALTTLKVAPGNTYCVDSTGNKLEKAAGTCAAATGLCS